MKSSCKSGSRRSPKTHRCKKTKSVRKSVRKYVRKSARKSVRKSSRKSVRKSSRKSVRKSSRKSARKSAKKVGSGQSPARHYTLNTRRKGRDGYMYKVAETKSGNLKWVQCGEKNKCNAPNQNIPRAYQRDSLLDVEMPLYQTNRKLYS